jgi:CheY-like chemotaxis protein
MQEIRLKAPSIQARVLVVEDNLINQKIAQTILEQLGCQVDIVANGREAIELPELLTYDLVFMDCEMPEMDGFEATLEIRRRPTGRHLPIVAMTARALPEDKEQCLAAGMDDYISKPVQREDFVTVLARWVPQTWLGPLHEEQDNSPKSAPPDPLVDDRRQAGLDRAMIQRLKNLAQATEASLLIRLLELFQSDAMIHLTTMHQAITGDDRVSLRLAAHRLKGASFSIGAVEMGNICRRLENLDSAQPGSAAALMAQLEHEFRRIKAEIAQILQR